MVTVKLSAVEKELLRYKDKVVALQAENAEQEKVINIANQTIESITNKLGDALAENERQAEEIERLREALSHDNDLLVSYHREDDYVYEHPIDCDVCKAIDNAKALLKESDV